MFIILYICLFAYINNVGSDTTTPVPETSTTVPKTINPSPETTTLVPGTITPLPETTTGMLIVIF